MLDKSDIDAIRGIVRLETEAIVKQHLCALTSAVLAPMTEALATIQENQRLISDGQKLVEKHLAAQLPDDNEPWRGSLDSD